MVKYGDNVGVINMYYSDDTRWRAVYINHTIYNTCEYMKKEVIQYKTLDEIISIYPELIFDEKLKANWFEGCPSAPDNQ